MKLIIDISKSEYMEIKRYYDSLPEYSTVEAETYYIAHGTPLDDVKAEIAEEICLTDNPYTKETKYTIEHLRLLDILDNIGKAEGEDEE